MSADTVKFTATSTTAVATKLDAAIGGVVREFATFVNKQIYEVKKENSPKPAAEAQAAIDLTIQEMEATLETFKATIATMRSGFTSAVDSTVVVNDRVRNAIEELKRAKVNFILPDNITTTIPSIKVAVELPNAPTTVTKTVTNTNVSATLAAANVETRPPLVPKPVEFYYGEEQCVIDGIYKYPGNPTLMQPGHVYNENDQWLWVPIMGKWCRLIIPNIALNAGTRSGTDYYEPKVATRHNNASNFYSREEPHVSEKYHPFNIVARYEAVVYDELTAQKGVYGEEHHNNRITDYAGGHIAFGVLMLLSNRKRRNAGLGSAGKQRK